MNRALCQAVALAFFCLATASRANADEASEPWDEEDLPTSTIEHDDRESFAMGPLSDLLMASIDYYRIEIGPVSVSRCPYVVSCSLFARTEVSHNGFVGLFPFVDRYFFRENSDTFKRYPRVVTPAGVLKYDDFADRHEEHP